MRPGLLALTLLAAASACYRPELAPCRVTCAGAGSNDACPGAMVCLDDGYCHASADDALCAAAIDAASDAAAPSTRVIALAAGREHACAVGEDTELWCWGSNYAGQIGNGDGSLEPVPVPASLGTGWSWVAAGGERTCGVRDGELLCWGVTSREPVPVPAPAAPPDQWLAVAVGPGHLCAIGAIGAAQRLWCAGADFYGELGDGDGDTGSAQLRPVAMTGDGVDVTDWRQVSAGEDHTCAVRTGGEAYCWGRNDGALGDGTSAPRAVPTRVIAADDANDRFVAITAGEGVTAAIGLDVGRRYAWGGGVTGPGRVGAREDWTDAGVAFGRDATCAVTPAGPRCWGYGHVGQLGDGRFQTDDAVDGVAVAGLAEYGLIAAGAQFACFAPASGGVACWGNNARGQLGDGTVAWHPTPQLVDDTGVWTDVAVGTQFSCGVRDAELRCWGRNEQGQLGVSLATTAATTPVAVDTDGLDVVDVAVGDAHGCAVVTDGTQPRLWCWGANDYGEVGTGTTGVFAPVEISGVGAWSEVSAGSQSSSGRAGISRQAWGNNDGGRLGNDSTDHVATPTAMDAIAWAQVSQGLAFGCGLDNSLHLFCWGEDDDGEQGNGAGSAAATPAPIEASSAFFKVAASAFGNTVCAIRNDGALLCWGDNLYGGAGVAGGADVVVPTRIGTSDQWTDVSPGTQHTCGIDDGGLYCWGAAGDLEYAPVSPLGAHVPSRLDQQTWQRVAVGVGHACAITAAGALHCWGRNIFGELGNGSSAAGTPRAVVFP